jgi:hypothetical protein
MDAIAGEIGFFDPLFGPVFQAEVGSAGRLDFAAVDRIRGGYAPEASFQATVLATLKRWPRPAVYLEAALALTRAEARNFEAERVPANRPVPKLRVQQVTSNAAAEAIGLRIPRQLEVPESCLIRQTFFAREAPRAGQPLRAREDLGAWRRPHGWSLPPCPVEVEVRPGRHYIRALLQAPGRPTRGQS